VTGASQGETPGSAATQRIDKWLWIARLLKTRTLASEFVAAGKVRLNKAKVEKASHVVRVGDVLTMTLNRRVRLFMVTGLAERRGPSAAARSLYEELTAPVDTPKPHAQSTLPIPSLQHEAMGPGRRAAGSGRPTKKERRDIDRLNAKVR